MGGPSESHEKITHHEFKLSLITLTSGALAGALAKTVIAPLDRTKINFQSCSQKASQPFSIRAGIRFMIDTVRDEKANILAANNTKSGASQLHLSWCNIKALKSLWRGNTATLVRISPFAAIQFTAHRHWKKFLGIESFEKISSAPPLLPQIKESNVINSPVIERIPNKYSFHSGPSRMPSQLADSFKRFLAGSLAGLTASSLTYPLDLARARMAVTPKDKYSNLSSVFRKIVRLEGWSALYRGVTPTLLGSIPYSGTSFCTYETLKRIDIDYHKSKSKAVVSNEKLPSSEYHIPSHHRLLYGALAGLAGQTSSYPLDVIRRRMQTSPKYKQSLLMQHNVSNNNANAMYKATPQYDSIISTAKYIICREGVIKGLYKGLSMNWIKGPIAVGISFSTFDTLQRHLIHWFP